MVKLKICGMCRPEDIDYANEARPDYVGFVFASSRRQVSLRQAEQLRARLAPGIVPVGVFVNAPITDIAALYWAGVIEMAQLHGGEDAAYLTRLRQACTVPLIQAVCCGKNLQINTDVEYILLDSGAGSGQSFDWGEIPQSLLAGSEAADPLRKRWFLAGGISLENIDRALALQPFGVDLSSGVETDGVKNRAKILQVTERVRAYEIKPL